MHRPSSSKKLFWLPVALISFALAGTTAYASPPPGKGYDKEHKKEQKADKHMSKKGGKMEYSDNDRVLIHVGITVGDARVMVHDTRIDTRPYQALPPGIAKNLARGKPLPPGIAKKTVPPPLLARLPVYPGYEWQVAGTSLILVYSSSGIVADILINVF